MISLSDRIHRWRHSRGFGVHSPAAFMLVRDVVRPRHRYRYYAEDRLDVARIARDQRLLARLAIRLYGRLGGYEMLLNADPAVGRLLNKEGIRNRQFSRSCGECVPFARILFRVPSGEDGEVALFHPESVAGNAELSELFADSLILDSPRFLMVYKAPGLTPHTITLP